MRLWRHQKRWDKTQTTRTGGFLLVAGMLCVSPGADPGHRGIYIPTVGKRNEAVAVSGKERGFLVIAASQSAILTIPLPYLPNPPTGEAVVKSQKKVLRLIRNWPSFKNSTSQLSPEPYATSMLTFSSVAMFFAQN